MRFSLQRLFALATLSCIFLASWSASWRMMNATNGNYRNDIFAVVSGVAAFAMALPSVYVCLVVHAAADPLLGVPSALKRPPVRDQHPLGPVLAIASSLVLALGFALPTGLIVTVVTLSTDGQLVGRHAELSSDIFNITYGTLMAALFGALVTMLTALYFGAPLGRGFLYVVTPCATAPVAIYTLPLLGPMSAYVGYLGLACCAVGVVAVFTCFDRVRTFGRSARAWSGRGTLLFAAFALAIALAWSEGVLNQENLQLAGLLPLVAAFQGGAAGALFGAWRESRRPIKGDSPFNIGAPSVGETPFADASARGGSVVD